MMDDAQKWHEITLTAERVEALRKRAVADHVPMCT